MAVQRDRLIIVDIEATCWASKLPPPGEQNEIIEVGVCALDLTTWEILDKRSLLVRPTRSKVSDFCTTLTTLTQAMVDDGMTFAEACATLRADYDTQNRAWGSWGSYDRKMFEAQCASFGVDYPFSEHHLNIKGLFADALTNKRRLGMAAALKKAGLELEGTHHRGHDDAYNIARLLRYVIQQRGEDVLLPLWMQK